MTKTIPDGYTTDEMARRAALPEFIEAMKYVRGAQIVLPAHG